MQRTIYNALINWCFFISGPTAIAILFFPHYIFAFIIVSLCVFWFFYKTPYCKTIANKKTFKISPIGPAILYDNLLLLSESEIKQKLALRVFEKDDQIFIYLLDELASLKEQLLLSRRL